MAKVAMPSSTSAAATSSCVLSGFEAQSVMSAPPACRVCIRWAVSLVTWRQAETRTPLSGFCLRNRSSMLASTGMDREAHSIRPLPFSANLRSLTSCGFFIFATATGYLQNRPSSPPRRRGERGVVSTERTPRPPRLRGDPSCLGGAGGLALEAGGAAEGVGPVGPLPGELGLAAAEVAVGGGLLVDRAQEVQVLDDARRLEAEGLADRPRDLLLRDRVGPERLHHHADRLRDADRVSHLHLAAARKPRGDHVLRHPARRVGRRAIHLARILAAERAAAVMSHPPVGVDDDLA